jgi:hypothetical protein
VAQWLVETFPDYAQYITKDSRGLMGGCLRYAQSGGFTEAEKFLRTFIETVKI